MVQLIFIMIDNITVPSHIYSIQRDQDIIFIYPSGNLQTSQ